MYIKEVYASGTQRLLEFCKWEFLGSTVLQPADSIIFSTTVCL